jgi:hypothetical protein
MVPWWSSLVGVILGGLLGGWIGYLLERLRRRQRRLDKLDDARREALRCALAWIDPMEAALISAEVEIYALLNGTHDVEEFKKRYPDLASELTKVDLSGDQRLVLAADPYPPGNAIRRAVESLKYEAIQWWSKTNFPIGTSSLSVVDARYKCTVRVKQLRQQIEALRQRLAEDYRKTYE